MTYEDIVLIDTASRNALQAATVLDRLLRGIECDTATVQAFLNDLAEVYGPTPEFLAKGLSARDVNVLAFLKDGALAIHDKALTIRPSGPFEAESFDDMLAVSKPLTAELLAQIEELVGGIEVDLDEPLDGLVSI